MNHQLFHVTGMTCGGCVAQVKKALAPYAEEVNVTLNPPEAHLKNSRVDIQTMNQALRAIGKYHLTAQTKPAQKPASAENLDETRSWLVTYFPLLLILGYILLVSIGVQFSPLFAAEPFDVMQWMMHFMAGFFLVFSFFKLLDIKAFASTYAMYDLLAMRVPAYGFVYPFIELGLGIAYLVGFEPTLTNWMTLIVMGFSSLGVIRAVLSKQKIRCACLGAVFNLPMSTVTIIEDVTMAGMALWMLI